NKKQGKGDNYDKPIACARQIFKLPPELWPISRRQNNLPIIKEFPCICNETTDITTANIAFDDNQTRPVQVADLRWPLNFPNRRKAAERDALSIGTADQEI